MNISIEPLTDINLESFLTFFDEIGFTDNPDWAHCYCVFFHHHQDESDWLKKTGSAGNPDRGNRLRRMLPGVLPSQVLLRMHRIVYSNTKPHSNG